jgi:hypothetical protein
MNSIILGAIILVCGIIGYVFLFRKIIKQSDNFYNTLNGLKEKAISAKTKEDLDILSVEINNAFGDSWNYSQHPRIIEVRTIITTKYQMLDNFKKQ